MEEQDIWDLGSSETSAKYHMFGIPNTYECMMFGIPIAKEMFVIPNVVAWHLEPHKRCLEFQSIQEKLSNSERLAFFGKRGVLTATPKQWHQLN